MASATGAELQNRQLLGFCEVPLHFGGPKGRTRRTVQNRQLLGFCEVPSISAVPEAGNQSSDRFHHATCRHFQRCEPTDITGRNLPMMPIPLSLDAHQCVLVARAWRVENAKRRQALTVSWPTTPRSSCDICQPKWRTSWGRTTPLHLSSDVC